jgi:hypothetical protein
MTPHESGPEKETFFIHELSPQLEEELLRRARENGRDPSEEASELIEEEIRESDVDIE